MEVVLNVSTNGYISGKGINHPFTSQTQKPYKTVNCVQTITSLDNNLVEIDIKNVNATVPLGFKKGEFDLCTSFCTTKKIRSSLKALRNLNYVD